MLAQQLELLKNFERHLSTKTEKAIAAFQQLKKVEQKGLTHFVLFFCYETIETFGVSEKEVVPYSIFEEVVSRDEMEEYVDYDYVEEVPIEDFIYWKTFGLSTEIFEMWLASCCAASKIGENWEGKIYFLTDAEAENVLELNSCDTFWTTVGIENPTLRSEDHVVQVFPK